jgi:hypothetical protein
LLLVGGVAANVESAGFGLKPGCVEGSASIGDAGPLMSLGSTATRGCRKTVTLTAFWRDRWSDHRTIGAPELLSYSGVIHFVGATYLVALGGCGDLE